MPSITKTGSLLAKMDKVPPWMCRILAVKYFGHNQFKKGKFRGMPVNEIADVSGVPKRTVSRILYMASWDAVKIGTASRILEACKICILAKDPTFRYKRMTIARDGSLSHLTQKQRIALDAVVS